MARISFHRLPTAVALTVSLVVGFGATFMLTFLPHWFDADRTRHRVEAVEFLARLHEAKGATRWE